VNGLGWSPRAVIAMILWVLAGLLTLVFLFSGAWIYVPFLFALGGGGEILLLLLAIVGLATSAYFIGRPSRG
jgi:hypothetical protein